MSALPTKATIRDLTKTTSADLLLHGMTGWVSSMTTIPDRFRRLGQTGSGSQSVGSEGAMNQLSAWRQEMTTADAIATIGKVEALVNHVVRITDSWGRIIPRAKIWAASASPLRGKGHAGATVLVRVSLTVERLPDA